ncbi:MAG TPA: DNA polymerase IV [Gemmatimonadales bacterium]|nr:DNA polymerase IV [Gemmatimonadales bacterium]
MVRRILLADADAFYVAVARAVDPEGAGKATLLIVGGSRDSRGVVCSASYEARKFGVRSAMPMARALRLCPDAVCVPVPFKECWQKSAEIRSALQQFTPVVEGASVDEWYLDMTGTEGLYHHEPLAATAARIRAGIRKATGLTLSIGGGTNKLIAKMAVDRAKPSSGGDGVMIVEAGGEAAFLRTCTLADIPLVGPKFQARLAARGLVTVADVLRHDLATLEQWMSAREAAWLWSRVHGSDAGVVAHREQNRGLSRDETFGKDLHEDGEIAHELLRLVTRAAADLRGDGLTARTIAVKLRDFDFKTRSAQRTLREPVVSDRVILEVAHELLAGLRNARRVPARLVGVRLSGLAPAQTDSAQLALVSDADETARDRGLASAIDRVRDKYGPKSIVPGALTTKH